MADELHYKRLNDRNPYFISTFMATYTAQRGSKKKISIPKSAGGEKMKIPRSSRLRGIVMSIVGFNRSKDKKKSLSKQPIAK